MKRCAILIVWRGRFGLAARGVVFGIIGVFLNARWRRLSAG
ncbi:MAG TPA: hypothetical protein VF166_03185 [Gemmatimonadaceae bacterium]